MSYCHHALTVFFAVEITIAEYEGSPRRYRPRGCNETTSNASSEASCPQQMQQQQSDIGGVKFKQQHRALRSSSSASPSLVEQPQQQHTLLDMSPVKTAAPLQAAVVQAAAAEELLKFDEDETSAVTVKTASDYDFRYEFSETRKVLDEFFNKAEEESQAVAPAAAAEKQLPSAAVEAATNENCFSDLNYTLRRCSPTASTVSGSSYVAQRLAEDSKAAVDSQELLLLQLEGVDKTSSSKPGQQGFLSDIQQSRPPPMEQPPPLAVRQQLSQQLPQQLNTMMVGHTRLNVSSFEAHKSQDHDPYTAAAYPAVTSAAAVAQLPAAVSAAAAASSPSSSKLAAAGSSQSVLTAASGGVVQGSLDSRNFTLSPETTDCDSADLESEVSINEGSYHSSGPRMHTAMPILEDGLSSGHASDMEDDVIYSR